MDVSVSDRPTVTDTFKAMGSPASITVVGDTSQSTTDLLGPLHAARRSVERLEQQWSRFIPSSDITRLNNSNGAAMVVDPSTVRLVVAMIQSWHATDGAFDPTLLGALVGLGYAADWDDPSRVSALGQDTRWRGSPDEILVDIAANVVVLPRGTSLDAGGIGKGLAADIAVAAALDAGAAGALVDIGGDMFASGRAPQDGGWIVGVADPRNEGHDHDLSSVLLLEGGVATSGTLRRCWTSAIGERVHHLLDPSTGRPAQSSIDASARPSPLVAATVVAGTGAWAEVWTKALMVRPIEWTFGRLDELGLGAMVVDADGNTRINSSWSIFATETPETSDADLHAVR